MTDVAPISPALDDLHEMSDDTEGEFVLPLEPRCRVCRNDAVRGKVNEQLASGATYAAIHRALAEDNANVGEADRVTIDSIRRHAARHYPVQNVAKATYRDILEQRARENGVDFVDGVATAVTPLAFLETVVVKSYQALVSGAVTVDANTAVNAAVKLQTLLDARKGDGDIAEMLVELSKIKDAVRSTVPKEMWADILAKLED
ncbi:hypothetical protein Y013_04880 [Rhodococcus pyridinivorans SB3094]|uniref:Uncharacterized protein n=2 Tax=Rhodococcus pyridinivorans TaxID=103816 RepID=V9XMK6_9NOCA|nr:hypothetical protein Y013_04880 [Rhodococcus pyridinivorans SB3094]